MEESRDFSLLATPWKKSSACEDEASETETEKNLTRRVSRSPQQIRFLVITKERTAATFSTLLTLLALLVRRGRGELLPPVTWVSDRRDEIHHRRGRSLAGEQESVPGECFSRRLLSSFTDLLRTEHGENRRQSARTICRAWRSVPLRK